jgi:hypothetical protein
MGTILWSKLGSPTEPNEVHVKGLGIVEVSHQNIQAVAKLGEDDPEFDLIDATAIGDSMRRYFLGLMR